MSPEEATRYVENFLEPKLQEISSSYAVLLENSQYVILYNGFPDRLSYMLGQMLQELISSRPNRKEQDLVHQSFMQGYNEEIDPNLKEEF